MILQLNPTIPVITPLGRGDALFLIDYGQEVNTVWVVSVDNCALDLDTYVNRQIKHFCSEQIQIQPNYTFQKR